jgi:putative transposase
VPEAEELTLMRWIDAQYLATPFYGSRRMTAELRLARRQVNRKRVQRLMRLMGLEALGPKPKTSRPAAQHRIHSYITCSAAWRSIGRPRCGLQTPRTPDRLGLFYLVVILGWCSR